MAENQKKKKSAVRRATFEKPSVATETSREYASALMRRDVSYILNCSY
jgi:hypothetical protein